MVKFDNEKQEIIISMNASTYETIMYMRTALIGVVREAAYTTCPSKDTSDNLSTTMDLLEALMPSVEDMRKIYKDE